MKTHVKCSYELIHEEGREILPWLTNTSNLNSQTSQNNSFKNLEKEKNLIVALCDVEKRLIVENQWKTLTLTMERCGEDLGTPWN